MAKSTVPPTTLYPGNYIGIDFAAEDTVRHLAYGLRVNSELAFLAFKGLQATEREIGPPPDDVYAIVESLIHSTRLGAHVLAKKLEALPDGVA